MKKTSWFVILCFSLCVIIPLPVQGADPIRIAAIFAMSGEAKLGNLYYYQGIRLAVEEINETGGLSGRQLEVIELDNKSTAVGSKMAAMKAVRLDVAAVIGAAWSSHSLSMAPVLQQAGIPMISPASTNPKVTLAGDHIFRVCFIDPFQGRVMAQFALRDLAAKRAVILTNSSSDYSMGLSDYFRDAFTQDGGSILWEGKYLGKAIDFTDMLSKTKALNPDVIFSPGHPRDSSLLMRQAAKNGIQTVFLGGDGWGAAMLKFGGKAVEGHHFSTHWHKDAPFPLSKKVLASYHHHKFDKGSVSDVPFHIPLTYDAVMVLADAVTRAQSLDRKKIRDALAVTKGFQGATGTITFDENGDPLNKDAVILKFDKGKVVFVKTIKP